MNALCDRRVLERTAAVNYHLGATNIPTKGLCTMRVSQLLKSIVFSVLAFAPSAHAYNSVIQTGDVVEPGAFQLAIVPQVILSRYKGVGLDAMLDVGVDTASSIRGVIGVGDGVDFQVGGLYKYIPFPDTENQPAIGGEAGLVFARTAGKSEVDLRFNPLISNKYESEIGDITPYVSLPVGIEFRDGESLVPVQLALGTELRLLSTPQLSFFLEGAVNLHDAFGSISGALTWRFEEVKLRSRK